MLQQRMTRRSGFRRRHAGRGVTRLLIEPRRLRALYTVLMVLLPLHPASAQPAARRTMSASAFVGQVETAGIDEERIDVTGTVDLRRLERVAHPLRCTDCTIYGSLIASDVIFERIVDLSGTRIDGTLDLHRALFRAAFLLQTSAARPSSVAKTANLDLATFGGQAGFDQARFLGQLTAQNTSMIGNASFVESEFRGDTHFDRAVFAEMADFSMSTFGRGATFDRAHITGAAVFGYSTFDGPASFVNTNFHGSADFSGVLFNRNARFTAASFGEAAAFRLIESYGLLSLDRVRALGAIDFGAADLVGGLSLSALTSPDLLSLSDALVDENAKLHMVSVRAGTLLMDLEDVARIPGIPVRGETLELLEKSARQRGSLAAANNARFELLRLQNGLKQQRLARLADAVFYQAIGGYLVRPLHPISALMLAILFAGVLRAAHHHRSEDQPPPAIREATPRQHIWVAYARLHYVTTLLWDSARTSASMARWRGPANDANTAGQPATGWIRIARKIEKYTYRTLLGIALISLGNTSSTIREIIDAIRP